MKYFLLLATYLSHLYDRQDFVTIKTGRPREGVGQNGHMRTRAGGGGSKSPKKPLCPLCMAPNTLAGEKSGGPT